MESQSQLTRCQSKLKEKEKELETLRNEKQLGITSLEKKVNSLQQELQVKDSALDVSAKKKNRSPSKGLEPVTLRLKA